jgi:hypothetical protein
MPAVIRHPVDDHFSECGLTIGALMRNLNPANITSIHPKQFKKPRLKTGFAVQTANEAGLFKTTCPAKNRNQVTKRPTRL